MIEEGNRFDRILFKRYVYPLSMDFSLASGFNHIQEIKAEADILQEAGIYEILPRECVGEFASELVYTCRRGA